jgi:hypothetical protein
MPLSQIILVDLRLEISNGWYIGPSRNPKFHDDVRNQGRTLNRTRHLTICQPLSNNSLNRGDLDLSHRGLQGHHLISTHNSYIPCWKESDGKPPVPQSESGVQDIVAPRCQLAMDRPTRELFPKIITIKTATSLLERNNVVTMKTEGATKIFLQNSIWNSRKLKWNSKEILTELAPLTFKISPTLGENTCHLNLEQEIQENQRARPRGEVWQPA